MVSTAGTINSKKRKQQGDMAESPPKRVTRARAKANEDSELGIKITTASARAGAGSKTSAKVTRTAPRKAQEVVLKADKNEHQAEAKVTSKESVKTRGRPKKTAVEPKASTTTKKPTLRTRSRQEPLTKDPPETEPEASITKAQPKKDNKKSLRGTTQNKDVSAETEPSVKATRSRAPIAKVKASTVSTAKPSVPKKKVTFQDETYQDKENVPVLVEAIKQQEHKATGLGAKPVRKPVTAKASMRGKKAIVGKAKSAEVQPVEEEVKPLSPKKVTQVAKSSSTSSDDELCGDKTPVRALSKSPIKPPTSNLRNLSIPASKGEESASPESPTKLPAVSTIISPARRPPPSPFKDCLKVSPRRINIVDAVNAKRSFGQSQTPQKFSLIKSPARRPMSPSKALVLGSPGKSIISIPVVDAATASKATNSFSLPAFTPRKFQSSPLRADKSTARPVKVHRITPAELEAQAEPERVSVDGEDNLVVVEDSLADPLRQSVLGEPWVSSNAEVALAVEDQSLFGSPMEGVENTKAADPNLPAEMTSSILDPAVARGTTPPGGPDLGVNVLSVRSPAFRPTLEDSDSEDELQSGVPKPMVSPLQKYNVSTKDFATCGTPTPAIGFQTPKGAVETRSTLQQSRRSTLDNHEDSVRKDFSMTPLAVQLSSRLASSPEKQAPGTGEKKRRGIFSPAAPSFSTKSGLASQSAITESPLRTTFFEDEMIVRDQEAASVIDHEVNTVDTEPMTVEASQESHESEEYGDENAVPIDPRLLEEQHTREQTQITCTPARVFQTNPREIHTVSKVPLRPSADDTPLRVTRKRSRSVSTPFGLVDELSRPTIGRSVSVISYSPECAVAPLGEQEPTPKRRTSSEHLVLQPPSTPSQDAWSSFGSPIRTIRKGADARILRGAVVYVDVHTTEGADASGIFVELLTQMGAKCVKQWNWNPSNGFSVTSPDPIQNEGSPSFNASASSQKVGITHVVFKDGGKRTMEKIRESKGLVLPVGVGWVLE